VQLTGLRKSGDEFPIELSLGNSFTDVTRILSGIIRDVSEREKALEDLTQSEERLRAIMDSTQDAIICADQSGHVVLWNPAAEDMFGHPEADMLGKPITAIIPERHRDAHDAGIRRLNMNEEPRAVGKTVELSALREDGCEFPIELSLGAWTIGKQH
jgi:PAS domain S-box-containing protein